MIFENQPLTLESTVKDDGVVVDLTGATSVKYYYWEPGVSGAPSGSHTATIIDAAAGTIEFDILKDTLTLGEWKFRGTAIFSNGEFPADEIIKITVQSINA